MNYVPTTRRIVEGAQRAGTNKQAQAATSNVIDEVDASDAKELRNLGISVTVTGTAGAVTRKGWDGKVWGANQRITVDEAIRVNTLNAAYASKEEHIKGSITAGKLADFVVLAEDPHTIDPEKIKDIQIVRTVVGGSVSYQA